MKPHLQFTVAANPATDWRVRVFIWKTLKHLQRVGEMSDCLAYCSTKSPKKAHKDKHGVFAELHFALGENLTAGIVSHECTHAAISFADLNKLRCADPNGEEYMVVTQEHLFTEIVKELKKWKLKVAFP